MTDSCFATDNVGSDDWPADYSCGAAALDERADYDSQEEEAQEDEEAWVQACLDAETWHQQVLSGSRH
jgi:hypothetical protein